MTQCCQFTTHEQCAGDGAEWMKWVRIFRGTQAYCGPPLVVGFVTIVTFGCLAPPQEMAREPTDTGHESWTAIYLEGQHVGYVHNRHQPWTVEGKPGWRIESTTEMTVRRFGQKTQQTIVTTSWEQRDGTAHRFTSSVGSGGAVQVTEAERSELGWQMVTRGPDGERSQTVPCPPDSGSFFALEQSLRRKPMIAGESRTVRSIVPVLYQPTISELHAIALEETDLPEGPQNLLRIEETTQMGRTTLSTTLWTDASGEILKTRTQAGATQLTYRTTQARATSISDDSSFDLGLFSLVPAEFPGVDDPHATRDVRYQVRMSRGDPSDLFATDPWQTVRPQDPTSCVIQVVAGRPNTSESIEPPPDPPENFLRPEAYIESDDPVVQELAQQVPLAATDGWALAVALERLVHDRVTATDLSQALSTAAEVARSRRGDCTEHAVLLAAVCRAKGLPARLVTGLVYSGREKGFAYHMWDEVWIRGTWFPLDATLGRGGIGGAHLKIGTAGGEQGAMLTNAVLPVVEAIGAIKIEVIAAE